MDVQGISCKWFEERRKDYIEMMCHHILTVALILTAQINGETAMGMVVLAVHDTSDVFLDLMKMANYLKVRRPPAFVRPPPLAFALSSLHRAVRHG
jgi:ceramide synthetase